MQPFRRAGLLATITAAFFALGGLSSAGIDSIDRSEIDSASLPQKSERVPTPIVGDRIVASFPTDGEPQLVGGVCRTVDDVLQAFVLDIENVGGDVVIMTDGLQQEFSNSWRGLVDGHRVEVSLVLAHLIPDSGGKPIVDVVEMDGNGCALSRTLLTAEDWLRLISLANSIEV